MKCQQPLVQQRYHVRTFDRSAPSSADKVTHLQGDLANALEVERALEGCDVCFHCASTLLPQTSNSNPIFDIETNLKGAVTLLNAAVKANVKKIIFISSGGTVYGKPTTLPIEESHPTKPICSYGIIKLAIEHYLALYEHLYGLQSVVLRLANPFGPRPAENAQQGVIACFLKQAITKGCITVWGDGTVIRDYIYISDVIEAFLCALHYTGDERIFNISSAEGRSVNEVILAIEQALKKPVKRVYTASRSCDVPANVLAIARAQACLGWSPKVAFQEGVDNLAQWYLETQMRSAQC